MATTEFKSDFLDRIEARSAARGEARGEAWGTVRGEARSLLIILAARGIALTEEQEEQVMTCGNSGRLEQWLNQAATAASADEVFKDWAAGDRVRRGRSSDADAADVQCRLPMTQ
jgi:hypothetical protein